jgi:hypothetical protein
MQRLARFGVSQPSCHINAYITGYLTYLTKWKVILPRYVLESRIQIQRTATRYQTALTCKWIAKFIGFTEGNDQFSWYIRVIKGTLRTFTNSWKINMTPTHTHNTTVLCWREVLDRSDKTGIIKRYMVGSYVTGRNTKERRWNRQEVVGGGGGMVEGGNIDRNTICWGLWGQQHSQFPGSQLLLPTAMWTYSLAPRTFVFYRLRLDVPLL